MALVGGAHILIVEDEFLVRMDLQSRLSELGYENIYYAEDISRAFELIDIISLDFAILDVNIGRDLVFPIAAKLASGNVPFVFSTGLSPETLPVEWQCRPVLAKPVTQPALEAALRSLNLWDAAAANPVACAEDQLPADESVSAPMLFASDGDGDPSLTAPTPSLLDEPHVQSSEGDTSDDCEPDPHARTTDPSGGQVIASKPTCLDAEKRAESNDGLHEGLRLITR
jgi:CheY-like chemotaxis protein